VAVDVADIDDPEEGWTPDGIAIDFGSVSAWPDPGEDGLAVDITIPDLMVELLLGVSLVGVELEPIWAWISAEMATLQGDLIIDVDDGDLTVELENASVELSGFAYGFDWLPASLTDIFFTETIKGLIENMLVEQINEIVPPMLAEQLAGLDFSFETELLGRTLEVSAEFSSAEMDSYGLALGLDIDAEADSQGTHTYAGYLVSGDDEEPDVSKSSDIAMAASDDLLNRVLFEVWRSGVMDMTLSTTDGSLDEALLATLQADRGTIEISANLPPVVVEKQGDLLAQFGEFEIVINTPGGGLGEFLEIVLFIEAPVEMAISDGAFGLTLEEPESIIMVRNSDWEASNEAITNLMEVLLPTDDFTSLMSDLAIPLPSLGTLTISSAQIARNTGTDFHTGIELALN
jgi:hypothetical protein